MRWKRTRRSDKIYLEGLVQRAATRYVLGGDRKEEHEETRRYDEVHNDERKGRQRRSRVRQRRTQVRKQRTQEFIQRQTKEHKELKGGHKEQRDNTTTVFVSVPNIRLLLHWRRTRNPAGEPQSYSSHSRLTTAFRSIPVAMWIAPLSCTEAVLSQNASGRTSCLILVSRGCRIVPARFWSRDEHRNGYRCQCGANTSHSSTGTVLSHPL